MKKKLLASLLALVLLLGMLPMSVLAADEVTAEEESSAPTVLGSGFWWTYDSSTSLNGIKALMGNEWTGAGVNWVDQTVWVVLDKPLAEDESLWWSVTVSGNEWGIVSNGTGTSRVFAASFTNVGAWEKHPEGATVSGLAEATKVTPKMSVYYFDEELTKVPDSGDLTADNKIAAPTIGIDGTAKTTPTYNGYTVAEWITDMQSAISGISIDNNKITLNDGMITPPNGAFLLVYANKDVFAAAEAYGTDEQKTTVNGFKTALESVKTIDASGVSDKKLTGLGTLAPFTKLEELNFANNTLNNGMLYISEIAAWQPTLKKLNLKNTGLTNINSLAGYEGYTDGAFTGLTELDLSNNADLKENKNSDGQTIDGITALAFLTDLTTLDISGTGVKDLGALADLTKLTSLKATNLTDVNVLGLVALVDKLGSDGVSSLSDGAFVFTDSTLDQTLTVAQKLAVNAMIDKLGDKATGLTKYTILDIAAAPANLTAVEGKEAPKFGWATDYSATLSGGVINVTATGLKEHENASGTKGYWVGVALTKLDDATYKWKFADGEFASKTTAELVADGRVQNVGGTDYVTVYWSTDDASTPWSETKGQVEVTYNGAINTYDVNFAVSVYTAPSSTGGGGGGGGGGGSSATVTVSSTSGGKVSVSDSNAKKGNTVTITTTPNTGKVVDTVTVTDAKGNKIAVTDAGNGKYTFVMPDGKVTVKVTFADDPAAGKTVFTDVPADAYYADAVAWAVEMGVTNGTGANTFSPEAPCTRGQIVTFLWRAAGSPKASGTNPFTDVKESDYFYDAVLWAVENGITNGTGADTFSPDNTCTRGQAVTFLYRYAGQPEADGSNPFADVAAGEYYTSAVLWAVEKGITNGTGADTFSPANTCTRGQIVTFLYRDLAE